MRGPEAALQLSHAFLGRVTATERLSRLQWWCRNRARVFGGHASDAAESARQSREKQCVDGYIAGSEGHAVGSEVVSLATKVNDFGVLWSSFPERMPLPCSETSHALACSWPLHYEKEMRLGPFR